MTRRRKQQALTTFLTRVNGKGRSMIDLEGSIDCLYVKNRHPGCAIGCQITNVKLKKEIKETNYNSSEISSLLDEFPEVKNILGIENHEDLIFYRELQILHDYEVSWNGKFLVLDMVRAFVKKYNLSIPKSVIYKLVSRPNTFK